MREVEWHTSLVHALVLRVILRVNVFPIVHAIVKVVPDAIVDDKVVFG